MTSRFTFQTLPFSLINLPNSWWKVKIKGDVQDEDAPEGLVPAAYVEPVRPVLLSLHLPCSPLR